ncbi:hypothetical protein ACFWPH_30900 [Nocardia sp. NPDC058499]|uniref:hypothetical protein n=1 Tax=Nocardia sp. NPDC058499 TaxID=3346530 RepID=UPI00366343E7
MLHALTEDLASYLSEVTQSDLKCPVPSSTRDVGDLYLHLVDQNISIATAITGEAISREQLLGPIDRASLDADVEYVSGGVGLDQGYRRTARLMEDAFTTVTDAGRRCRVQGFPGEIDVAALYEELLSLVVIHTWDTAHALGWSYQPAPDVTQRVLRTIIQRTTQTLSTQPAVAADTWPEAIDGADAFAAVLTLSQRVP